MTKTPTRDAIARAYDFGGCDECKGPPDCFGEHLPGGLGVLEPGGPESEFPGERIGATVVFLFGCRACRVY